MSSEQATDDLKSGDLPGDDLIEIQDPAVDPQKLMAEIRRRILLRRAEMGYDGRTFPSYGAALECPKPPDDMPYSRELYHNLRQVNELYASMDTSAALLPSPATRIPVLGRLWKLIRGQAHNLILYYVNRGLASQIGVNRHLVNVVNQLTMESQNQQRRIMALEKEVKDLRRDER